MADVKLPGIGPVSKKSVIFGTIGAGGVLVYVYVKHKNSVGSDVPTTGAYGYGAYGAYGSYGAYGDPFGYGAFAYGGGPVGGIGSSGYGGAYGSPVPTPPVDPGGGVIGTTGTPAPTTNPQWVTGAIPKLRLQGYTIASITNSLGRWLNGKKLDDHQKQIVMAALAAEGPLPKPAASGFPPGMHSQAPAGQSGGGSGSDGPKRTVTANGQDDLYRIAVNNGDTEPNVEKWNPSLKKYVGTGKPIPKGTKVRV